MSENYPNVMLVVFSVIIKPRNLNALNDNTDLLENKTKLLPAEIGN